MVRVSEGGEETEMAFLGFKFCKMSKDFPGSPVAKTLCRRFGLIPSQGTRSHMHI